MYTTMMASVYNVTVILDSFIQLVLILKLEEFGNVLKTNLEPEIAINMMRIKTVWNVNGLKEI